MEGNVIIKFNSPEEAYLYGLGQSIKNVTQGLGEKVFSDDLERRNLLISKIHQKAMEVINNKKIDIA